MTLLILLSVAAIVFIFRQDKHVNNYFDYKGLIVSFNEPIEDPNKTFTTNIILGGDVMLGRSVELASRRKDFNYPFLEIAEYTKQADIVFVNLENPIVEDCPARNNGLVFCANPEMLRGLKHADINVVNLANNHISNYGASGIDSTRKFLAANNIGYTGIGELYIKLVNGVKFGFLGFNRAESRVPLSDEEIMKVSDSAMKVDVLIVAMHWGNEYHDRANDYQRETARILVENGVDIVVGHHPHWVQDWEELEGKLVFYSLGNFVFDQMWSEKTRQGVLVDLTFEGSDVVSQEFKNIYIEKIGQPKLVEIVK